MGATGADDDVHHDTAMMVVVISGGAFHLAQLLSQPTKHGGVL